MYKPGDLVRLKDDSEGRGTGVVVRASDTVAESVLVSWARGPKRSHVRLIDLEPAGGVGGAPAVAVDDLLARLDAVEGEQKAEPMPFKVGDRVVVAGWPKNGVGQVIAFAHLVGDPDPDRVIVRFGDGLAVHYLPGELAPAPAGEEDETTEHDPDDVEARLMARRPPRQKACLWCGCVLCS
jgi:hypothetical protein